MFHGLNYFINKGIKSKAAVDKKPKKILNVIFPVQSCFNRATTFLFWRYMAARERMAANIYKFIKTIDATPITKPII